VPWQNPPSPFVRLRAANAGPNGKDLLSKTFNKPVPVCFTISAEVIGDLSSYTEHSGEVSLSLPDCSTEESFVGGMAAWRVLGDMFKSPMGAQLSAGS